MKGFNRLQSSLVLAMAVALGQCPAFAQDALSITGTFKMSALTSTVGDDLVGVFANGHDHWWKLTLNGVTYSHEYFYFNYDNGGYIEEFITDVNATSFVFEFFGPDAAVLNQAVSSQFAGGGLPGGAFLRFENVGYYETGFEYDHGDYAFWALDLSPLDLDAGVSFGVRPWSWIWPQFVADENGYPLVQPQRLSSGDSWLLDNRPGNGGEITSYDDIVDIGSDQQPARPPVQIDIADAASREGDRATIVVTLILKLSRASTKTVTVDYRTVNGTAVAQKDYTSATGKVTFQPGEMIKTIAVQIKGDRQREPDETFTVNLNNAVGANLGRTVGTATILNDD